MGAVLARVGTTDGAVESAFTRWAEQGWQPLTLAWHPPVRKAARLAHALDRLGYRLRFDDAGRAGLGQPGAASGDGGGPVETLARILDRGGWIVPRFATGLRWSDDPFLVHVLSLPLLAEESPGTVHEWGWQAGRFNYGEFAELFREHGAPPPKPVFDRIRLAGAAVWAATRTRRPTRRHVAQHLGYSSGSYLGRRVRRLTGLTAGELVRRPVAQVVEALVRGLGSTRPLPSGLRRKTTPLAQKLAPS